MTESAASRIMALADRLERLRPLNHDPEAYFVERNEIELGLRRIARDLAPSFDELRMRPLAARERFEAGAIAIGGRTIPVSIRRRRH